MVFDILQKDKENLTAKPMEERRKIIESLFASTSPDSIVQVSRCVKVEIPNVFEIDTEMLYKQLEEETERAYNDRCEGLVVKVGSSPYSLDGTSSNNWVKVKSKSGMIGDTLDLYPIAAYYGQGMRKGLFGAYLMAAYCPLGKVFYPLCKTGTGLDMAEMKQMTEAVLTDEANQAFQQKPDNYLVKPNMHPDVWLKPSESLR